LVAELGVSTLTPALPAISREFGILGGQVGLLITVFTFLASCYRRC
jgi:predicted MFS family arabinose efflux permease